MILHIVIGLLIISICIKNNRLFDQFLGFLISISMVLYSFIDLYDVRLTFFYIVITIALLISIKTGDLS